MKKVSIIIPVFNVSRYVSDCIDSVIQQSYKELEIIIVNDGSTDDSGLICQQKAILDKRIKYYEKENEGLSSARNYGLKNVTGELIYFLDSDDYLVINAIESLVDEYCRTNCDIVSSSFAMVDDKGRPNKKTKKAEYYRGDNNFFYLQNISNQACGKLYRKKMFFGITYPLGMHYEDMATTFKLYEKANRVSYTNCGLYCYRRRRGSITESITDRDIEHMWKAYEAISNHFQQPTKSQQFYKATVLYTIYSRLLRSTCSREKIIENEKKIYSIYNQLELNLEEYRGKSCMYIKLKFFQYHLTKTIVKIVDLRRRLFPGGVSIQLRNNQK